ncbi:hypothetical protein Rs2_26718 [Raphanus sativus]|uniref:Uncharacterized protein LOC130496077 n=1 Tax=Raphanus sativus TaxID=3726 RepID=A0A9W3BX01_RAPSA|nr:uncharacterized protein LOC130496077 [Raphanus sativus]KAJ4886970.1 hypothetical protein Rs2_26718 [Raphanus sativus]
MRFKPTSFHNPYFGHGRSLPRRGYDICHSPLARRREVNSEIENSDELISNLPESETQDEKISVATTSAPPMSRLSVDEQSLRMAALALEKKKKKSAPKALLATESKPST